MLGSQVQLLVVLISSFTAAGTSGSSLLLLQEKHRSKTKRIRVWFSFVVFIEYIRSSAPDCDRLVPVIIFFHITAMGRNRI